MGFLGFAWMVKMAVTSGAAMGVVDVGVQLWEKGYCYRHKPKKFKRNQYPPPTPEGDLPRFEVDMMRCVRSASFGAALAPLLNGLTLFFATPAEWINVTINIVATESLFAPLMILMYMDQDDVTIESSRTYVIPSLVIVSCGSYAAAYVLTMAMGHSSTFLPMLSYLGELPPESVVFTLGTAATATFYSLLVNIVSRQRAQVHQEPATQFMSNNTAVICGYVSALGLMSIAVFPAHALAAIAHYTGMSLFFLGSIPFLLVMAPDSENHSAIRLPLLITYGVSSGFYPLFYVKLPVIAAACETVAAASWVALIYDGRSAVEQGPSVEYIEGCEEDLATPKQPKKGPSVVVEAKESS
eukprot:PhF_6_TR6243/c0_g1_i1/m.9436